MINLPKVVMALFGISAVLDITIGAVTRRTRKKKRRKKMNRHGCSCKEIKSRKRHRRYCDRMRNYCYDTKEFKETGEDPGKAPGAIMMLPTIQQRQRAEQTIIIPFFVPSQFVPSSWLILPAHQGAGICAASHSPNR